MELDIQGRIGSRPPVQKQKTRIKPTQAPVQDLHTAPAASEQLKKQQEKQKAAAELSEKQMDKVQNPVTKDEIEKYLKKTLNDASIFNRDLQYSINRETNQIIVKVVDKTTDKVIKEIPPEAIQRLQASIREAIGLLVDEQI